METLAHAQVNTFNSDFILPVKSVKTIGSLDLKQTAAISQGVAGKGPESISNIRNTFNDNFFYRLQSKSASQLLQEYFDSRNETTQYNFQKYVQYGSPEDNTVEFTMIVKIPRSQDILYVPGAPQVLKFAWVQFFCAFLFWYFLLYKGLLNFLVTNRVFESVEVTDLNLKYLPKLQA